MKSFSIITLIVFSVFITCFAQTNKKDNEKKRLIYAYPPTDVINDSSAIALVDNCYKANFTDIILLIKDPAGGIYYHSEKFKELIKPAYKDFDALAAVLDKAHKYGIKVHAWFCDFTESPNSHVMKLYPEWAMLNPEGKTTSESEYLGGGKKYYMTWMCPARRPGYADQWLLPMMVDVAENYDVDGIHHDYVRYPGDVAPDDYCFCDYCLENIPKYAHFYYEDFKDSIFPVTPTLPKSEANWWSDPTVIPKGWFDWNRKQKAEFLLNGSFASNGSHDINYFFYTYRADAIKQFIKVSTEKLKSIKPDLEITASVFKNPIASGRFIGQRWTDFAQYVDIMMPMVYRSHFPQTDFNTFLKLFNEYVQKEYEWIGDKTNLSIVIDAHYIYNEERLFPIAAVQKIDSLDDVSGEKREQLVDEIKSGYKEIKVHLNKTAPDLEKEITELLNDFTGISSKKNKKLRSLINILNSDPPEDYYPKEKLTKVIEVLKKNNAKSISIFNYRGIDLRKLWSVLSED